MEPVKLLIWDLDETFWRGTLTEGGISKYIDENQAIVIELSKRRIMNSICSKNDLTTVRSILQQKEIWQYFVFPSIDWTTKGPRVKNIIELFQLRPESVLFIDDNPNNLAEAQAIVPGIQVASEIFAPKILNDPRFKGKSDESLSRLRQYKILEEKDRDRTVALSSGSNIEFLRSCGITVSIEYDIEPHIERAVGLINRTNQLNFTQLRLPENIDDAKIILKEDVAKRWFWSGLVRVKDRYGDYGFVGFFMGFGDEKKTLKHFCFSCRTIGMEIERWVFEHLGSPNIIINGEVLADLYSKENIDWINNNDVTHDTFSNLGIKHVRLRGGCELDSLMHYFGPSVTKFAETSYSANYTFLRRDNVVNLICFLCEKDDGLICDLNNLGIDRSFYKTEIFNYCESSTLILLNFWSDAYLFHYRHMESDLLIGISPDLQDPALVNLKLKENNHADISQYLSHIGADEPDRKNAVEVMARGLSNNFHLEGHLGLKRFEGALRRIMRMAPSKSRVVLILPPLRSRQDGSPYSDSRLSMMRSITLNIASEFQFVRCIDIEDCINKNEEVESEWHFHRIVYYRISSMIIKFLANEKNWTEKD